MDKTTELKKMIVEIMENTKKFLASPLNEPTPDMLDSISRAEALLGDSGVHAEHESIFHESLNWVLGNYKRILNKQRVTTCVEAFSFAEWVLLQEEGTKK